MSSEEKFYDAVGELKRADHSIAVSLKYTRTVDVIITIIERLTNTIEFAFDALLEKAKENGKIKEIPKVPRQKTKLVQELYKDDEFLNAYVDFYFILRKILKSKFERAREFRRHVTMTVFLEDDETIEITIDIITDYFDRVKELINHVSEQLQEKDDQN